MNQIRERGLEIVPPLCWVL